MARHDQHFLSGYRHETAEETRDGVTPIISSARTPAAADRADQSSAARTSGEGGETGAGDE